MAPAMIGLMALSGVIGIGLGDTMFFAGLNRMGARRVLLLFTINPVIMVTVAWAFMGEPLIWQQLIGIALYELDHALPYWVAGAGCAARA